MAQHVTVPLSIATHQALAAIVALESNPHVRAKLEGWMGIYGTNGNTGNIDFGMLHSIAQFSSQKTAIENWHKSLA